MSQISIERDHQLGREEAKKRLVDLEPKLREKYGVRLAWDGDAATLSGTGVSGNVGVSDSHLSINIKLGLMARPFAGKIRDSLERHVDKALG